MTLRAFRNYDPVAPLHSSITLKQKVALQVFRISGTLHKFFFYNRGNGLPAPVFLVCYLFDRTWCVTYLTPELISW